MFTTRDSGFNWPEGNTTDHEVHAIYKHIVHCIQCMEAFINYTLEVFTKYQKGLVSTPLFFHTPMSPK